MKKQIVDRKSWLTLSVFNTINKIALASRFHNIDIEGRENIPHNRSFLLVSNHITRWDGLLLQHLIGRPANFMVSPNELKGIQGLIIRSVGAYPADPRFDLMRFFQSQAARGEGMVIFPEGNIFRDGVTHSFKNGAARLALNAVAAGIEMSVIPMAIDYVSNGKETARCLVGQPVQLETYLREFQEQSNIGIRSLTVRLEREVRSLRDSLGASADRSQLLSGQPVKIWVPRTIKSAS